MGLGDVFCGGYKGFEGDADTLRSGRGGEQCQQGMRRVDRPASNRRGGRDMQLAEARRCRSRIDVHDPGKLGGAEKDFFAHTILCVCLHLGVCVNFGSGQSRVG